MAMTKPKGPIAPKKTAPKMSAAPEGFTELDLDMPSVHWEETSEVQGKIVDSDIFVGDKGAKRVLIIDLEGEPTRLFEQGGLRRLFDKAQIGDSVWVRTTGMRKLDGGRNLRVFEGGIQEGKGRKPIQAIPVHLQRRREFSAPDDDGVVDPK